MKCLYQYPLRYIDRRLCSGVSTGLFFGLVALWACNEEEPGLVRQSEIGTWQYFTETDGLASDYINTIFEDSKGNMWIGTNWGLSVYDDGEFTNFTTFDGLLDNNVFAITEDHEGDIWVGTPRGLNIYRGNQWLYFTYFYGAGVYALETLQDEGGILIGTGGYGTFRYDFPEQRFDSFHYTDNCQACNSINTLFQATDGSVWIASFQGAKKIMGNAITTIDEKDGLPGNIATSIAEDSWGNMWIGTVEGRTITKVTGNRVSQVSFNNGAEQNFIFGIQEDNEGNLWVGTVANGLFHYDGAIMRQMYKGPPDNTITALLKDSHGNLWIGTTQGGLAQYITNPRP